MQLYLCDRQRCFVFRYLHIIPTLGIVLVVILGYITTLIVKMGVFLGLRTTFEISGRLS